MRETLVNNAHLIQRELLEDIIPWISKEKILIIKGSRQVGKTTLLKQLETEIFKKDAQAQVAYLLADDLNNKSIFESAATLEYYLKQHCGFPSKYLYLMIDEFQVIDQAGLFLKNVFDRNKNKLQLIVSGSSSLEIIKNSEFLTGRAVNFLLRTVSFYEYFNFIRQKYFEKISLTDFDEIELFYKTSKDQLDLLFKDYLIYGGYPEVVVTPEIEKKKILLEAIIKTYLEKDIVHFLRIENISAFNSLLKILAAQMGNLVNINELSNTVNCAVNTTKRYLDIFVGTYIFDFIAPYFRNIRTEISKMPKAYILDFGIRSYLLRRFVSDDMIEGDIVENFIYLTFLDQFSKQYIHFYRTVSGSEIDFMIEKDNGRVLLCEVKFRSKVNCPTPMKKFVQKYQEICDEKIVITKDILKKEDGFLYIPAIIFPFLKIES